MSSVEERLAAFRARKRQEHENRPSGNQPGSMTTYTSRPAVSLQVSNSKDTLGIPESERENDETEELIVSELEDTYEPANSRQELYFRIAYVVLKISLWASLWFLFINLGFGAVFFVISAFYFIFTNLRTRPKLKNEPSAYSVFNPNCEPIEGTVNPEDLQRQMLFL